MSSWQVRKHDFSCIRSTHLPQSSLPHRPQQIIQRKPFNVRLLEDFDYVSLVETHLYQENFNDRRASLYTEVQL